MRSHFFTGSVVAVLAGSLAGLSEAAPIVSSNFVSTGSNVNLNGTSGNLSANEPGGTWVWGAGWNWAQPMVNATWMGGTVKDAAYLSEEDTALGISIASNSPYSKPATLHLSGDLRMDGSLNNTAGLGFWSAMPARSDGGASSSTNNFTGIIMDEVAGTLRVYSGGALQGSAVSVGSLSEGVFYTLSYDVDTATGALSNVVFNGSPVSGLTSSAFTDSATAYAGAMSGGGSRLILDNLLVEPASVPEPATLGLAAIGLVGLTRRRRA